MVSRLERFKLRMTVTFTPLGWSMLALRGPGAAAVAAVLDGQPLMTGHLGGNISIEQGQESDNLPALFSPEYRIEVGCAAQLRQDRECGRCCDPRRGGWR